MREIKFRLWHIKSKEMFYSSLATMNILIGLDGSIKDVYIKEDITSEFVKLQFTGLKDKNGKEIYEKDGVILHSYDYDIYGIVEYRPSLGFYCKVTSVYDTNDCVTMPTKMRTAYITQSRCEVIGNIYENPELLEAKWKVIWFWD